MLRDAFWIESNQLFFNGKSIIISWHRPHIYVISNSGNPYLYMTCIGVICIWEGLGSFHTTSQKSSCPKLSIWQLGGGAPEDYFEVILRLCFIQIHYDSFPQRNKTPWALSVILTRLDHVKFVLKGTSWGYLIQPTAESGDSFQVAEGFVSIHV